MPRLFLFYGTDSRSSLTELHRWEEVFSKKYGAATRFVIDADELGVEETRRQLAQSIAGQTLFAEPTLVVVKRLSALDAKKGTALKPVLAWLAERAASLDEDITVVLWEERDLPEGHALLVELSRLEAGGHAKLQRYQVPTDREVPAAAQRILAPFGKRLTGQAMGWLQNQYRLLDRQYRLQQRLKATDQRSEDERGWWLATLLEGAALRAEGDEIGVGLLEEGQENIGQPVGVFEIGDALGGGSWVEALRLLRRFESQGSDDSAYFGLYAALAWHLKKGRSRLSASQREAGLRLLAEIEILAKSLPLEHPWLVLRFTLALRHVVETGDYQPILEPRRLWLAGLARS